MQPRTKNPARHVNTVTLGVEDVQRAKRFYIEGFGCPLDMDAGEFAALSLGEGSSSLALYQREALAKDAGVDSDGSGFQGLTLSYIAESAEQVDLVIAAAVRAGATVAKPARRAVWGGYSGHVTDPDGFLWKVASSSGPGLLRRRPASAPAQQPVAPSATQTGVTIGVRDLKRTQQFYTQGLGLPVDKSYSKFVSFASDDASSPLSLYPWAALADDAGVTADGGGFRGFTLSCLVETAEQVDATLTEAERSGGAVHKPGRSAQWGGYCGYFTDPDGYLWKVAATA